VSERGNSSARAKAAKKTEIEDRKRKVAALALARMTLSEIVVALAQQGITISKETASRDLRQVRAAWREEQRVTIAAAQEQELAALASDEARLRSYLVKLAPNDWEARVAYQDRILKVQTLRAKILGTEAPQKIEQKIDTTVEQRRTILSALPEEDRKKLAEIAAKVYAGPRATLAVAITTPSLPMNGSTNGNGTAPHN
jgi:hypothetical protein